jgi:hypothetical protein
MKPLILTLKTIVLVALAFLFGVLAAQVLGVPQMALTAGTVLACICLIPRGTALRGSMFTIIAADVVTEWGAYYRQQGQTFQDIVKKLMQKSVTAGYFPTRFTNNTILEKVSAEFARVLQRFQKGFTPIGSTTFEPMRIQLYKLKIDLMETPDDIEETWLGFLADNSLTRKDWPFIKWYLANALDQADKDLELSEIWAGVPGTVTAGTANAAGTSLLGIRKQINDINTAGTGSMITMGAVPTDAVGVVDYVEEMIEAVPELLRNELDFVFLNQTNRNLFRDGMRTKYNTYYADVDDNKITKLRNYNIQLAALPSMVGNNKIWATPLWNRQAGFKKPGNEKIFQVENVDRNVKAYTDYFKGFGFWISQYLVYNDVDLV